MLQLCNCNGIVEYIIQNSIPRYEAAVGWNPTGVGWGGWSGGAESIGQVLERLTSDMTMLENRGTRGDYM